MDHFSSEPEDADHRDLERPLVPSEQEKIGSRAVPDLDVGPWPFASIGGVSVSGQSDDLASTLRLNSAQV